MNKIITTIEQDREMFEEKFPFAIIDWKLNSKNDGDGESTDKMKEIQIHLSLSIEHVLESLKKEVEMKKLGEDRKLRKSGDWDLVIGFNEALSSVSTLIDEVIKHVKK